GVLDVRAKTITDEMALSASYEIARFAEEKGLSEDYIVPTMEEWEIYPRIAASVATKAVEQGLARKTTTYKEELERASEIIGKTREKLAIIWQKGYIPKPIVDYNE
ncbi:MAG: malate dehydrogenase, partial [Caldisphaeraceae archaeon]|nr:malate dehydrogenase [Caldisphaeraceae archaeon]